MPHPTLADILKRREEEFDEKLSDFLWDVTKGGAEIDDLDRYPSVRVEAKKLKSFNHQTIVEVLEIIQRMVGRLRWDEDIISAYKKFPLHVIVKRHNKDLEELISLTNQTNEIKG